MTRNAWIVAGATGGALLLGMGIGGAVAAEEAAAPAPAPTVTTTATVEAEPPPPERVEVEVAPQACLDALDYADEGFGYAGDAMDASSRALLASADFDLVGIEDANADIEAATDGLNGIADLYVAAKDECRAAG